MAELRDAGALGFTDDGKPVHRAAILRKALQYQRLCGGVLALHEEDPSLSGAGVMHEGEISARLGLAGIPSISESTMIARDAAIAGYEAGQDPHPAPVGARVGRGGRRGQGARRAGHRGGLAAPPHADRTTAVLERLDTRLKMNPPLRTEDDRQALVDGLRDGTIDCIATDHAPHAREEKEVPFEQAPMGTTGLETAFAAVHTELVVPGVLPLALIVERLSAGAALLGLPTPRIAVGEPAALCLIDLDAEWVVGEARLRVARGELLLRRPHAARPRAGDGRGGRRRLPRAGVRGERGVSSAYVLLEDGTRFDGDACGAPGHAVGEVVFTTGMSGYQESHDRPVVPRPADHVHGPARRQLRRQRGGDGVRPHPRARRDHARGDQPRGRPGAERGWLDWLRDCGVPGITGVDTRALVRHIRDAGAMRGGVFPGAIGEDEARALIAAEPPMAGRDLAREVTVAEPQVVHGDGSGPRLVALDTGIKHSIVRNFVARGATVELLPCTTPADELLARDADALFLVPTARATRRRSATSSTPSAASGGSPSSASASATSCSAGRSGWRRSSSRSATAAATIRSRTCDRPGRDHRAEPRLRGARRRRGHERL